MTEITKKLANLKLEDDKEEEAAASCAKRVKYDDPQVFIRKSFEMLDKVGPDHSFLRTPPNIVDRC